MKSVFKVTAALSAAALITAAPRQSQAQTAGDVVGYLQAAWQAYQEISAFLGSHNSGPTLAQQLQALQTNVLNKIDSNYNDEFTSTAQSVFQTFSRLGNTVPGDPSAPSDWTGNMQQLQHALDLYQDMAAAVAGGDMTNADQVYELAPVYATLVATYAGMAKMKGELFPGFPLSWADTNAILQPANNTMYKLVGADHYRCSRGSNPGRGSYDDGQDDDGTLSAAANSVFFKRLENASVPVGTLQQTWYTQSDAGTGGDGFCDLSAITYTTEYCNPVAASCTHIDGGTSCLSTPGWPSTPAENTTGVSAARHSVDIAYQSDPSVWALRVSMNLIMDVGGGTVADDASAGNTNYTLPEIGEMVDPAVDEPMCSGVTGIPQAYVQFRTNDPVVPVSFTTGYFTTGDSTNFFPNSQIRIWTATPGDVGRSNPVDTSIQATRHLVFRYANGHTSSAFVNVSLLGWDSGTDETVLGTIEFPPTPAGYWAEKEVSFTAHSNWDARSYVRMAPASGPISYFDAVWVTD